jgi:glycerol uptake facilitator-like aquaporin
MTLSHRLTAEALGTALLLAVVVGSGIMGERLAAGNMAVALLANSLATGCGLYVLITTLGPISGAHFNPAVTVSLAFAGEFAWRDVIPYVAVQIGAALAGVVIARWMFELPPLLRRLTCERAPANGGARVSQPSDCCSPSGWVQGLGPR